MKMKITWDNGVDTVVDVEPNQKLEKNFAVSELANVSAADQIKMISTPRSRLFLKMLQAMRNKFGSMKINSNYRTKAFNDKTPGADKKSRHLYGEAADWIVGKAKMNATLIQNVTAEWQKLCKANGEIGAINYYSSGFHLEIGSNYSYGSTTFKIRDYRGTSSDWK